MRASSRCTCDHSRARHQMVKVSGDERTEDGCEDCSCWHHAPRQKPNASERRDQTLEQQLASFLALKGTTYAEFGDAAIRIMLPNGETWRVFVEKIT